MNLQRIEHAARNFVESIKGRVVKHSQSTDADGKLTAVLTYTVKPELPTPLLDNVSDDDSATAEGGDQHAGD